MSDQPPPPTEKKPRRRSAPRKRKPAKSVEANDSQATDIVDAAPTPEPNSATAVEQSPEAVPAIVAGPRAARPSRQRRDRAVPVAVTDTSAETGAGPAEAGESPAGEPAQALIPRQAGLHPGQLIRVPLSVRWRDLDAFNHVNNSKYLSYLEEARLRWMLTVPGMGLDEHVAPVVAASNLNYRRPIGWPGEVVVELSVERLGSSSLTIGHRIVDTGDGGIVYCDGNVVMVWIDRESGRAAPLPDSVRTSCNQA
jgi:YbgC/YbaW family acyl-CoA thioester hydrolase